MSAITRARCTRRLPTVLSREELARLFTVLEDPYKLKTQLLYGTGMRLTECCRLRVKDVDFNRRLLVVRQSKGNKDRVVPPCPTASVNAWQSQLRETRKTHQGDLQQGNGRTSLPGLLHRKYPKADREWAWQYVFSAPNLVVGFPPRFMQEYLGRDLCYVYAANCNAGDHSVDALPGCPTIVVPRSEVSWQFYAWRDGMLESFASSYLRQDRVDETIAKYGYTDYTALKDEVAIQSDKEMTDRLSTLMLKLLVVLNTRPDLVEQGRCVRPERIKHGRVKHHELWPPNLIGWRYQAAVERGGDGTHASPRLHWRRGHVRRQPHGPGRGQRKLVWIEPVLVGAGVVEVR